MAPSAPTPRQLNSTLGRSSGYEQFFAQTVALTAPQEIIVPRPLNLNRPAESIEIRLQFRHAITVANKTNPLAESPATWLDRVRLSGQHRVFGGQTPIDLRGATAFNWPRNFGVKGNDAYLSIGAAAPTRQADAGQPLAQTLANYGNVQAVDVDISCIIPFGLVLGNTARVRSTIPFLYKQQDWADSGQLRINLGDPTAVGTVNGSTDTLTAYQSGAGLPLLTIGINYSQLGPLDNPRNPGESNLIIRNEVPIVSLTAASAAQLLVMNLQKRKTANVVIKSGLIATQTAGLGPNYLSMDDLLLDATQIVVDTKAIRNNSKNVSQKSHLMRMFETIIPQGYFVASFVDSTSPLTAFPGDTVGGGAQFQLTSTVLKSNAGNLISVIQEQILSTRPPGM